MMSDIHALSGAYAVDALDDIERAQFERHLAECPECRAETDSLREAAGLLAETGTASPPAALRDRVLADIATVRPLPPVTTPSPGATPRHSRRWVRSVLAAAAAVAVVGAGATVWQPWEDDTTQSPGASEVDRVLQAADAQSWTRTFPDGSEATLTRSRELNRAVLVTEDMAPPPPGKVYALWLNHRDAGAVPAGLMTGGQHAVVLEGDPATATGAGITIEPEGGSEQPTLPTVTTFDFESA